MIQAHARFPRLGNGVFLTALLFAFLVCVDTAANAAPTLPAQPDAVPTVQTPDFFFTADLDPHYQFTGMGALTPEDAAQANCYQFTYNADGKPSRITFLRAGVPAPDPLLGVPRIDFEYQTGVERRWFRDAQGRTVRNVLGIEGEELKLNAQGYATDITNLDEAGKPTRDSIGVIHYVRTLDEHGRVIALRRTGLLGTAITDDNGFFETRTVYDAQGRPMERSNYDASGNLLDNDDGVALIRTIFTIYPDATQIIESYFDASGLAVEEKGSGVHQTQRMLDQRGFLIDESYFDVTGAPTVTTDSGIHERRLTYDDRGNELSESYFDPNGKLTELKIPDHEGLNYAKVSYKYDDLNRVIEKAYFGDDGKPQILLSLGAAVIRQEYDAAGNLVRRQFLDGQGHPSPHVQYGVPGIRIAVEGDTTIITLRSGNDKPAKNPVSGYYAFSYKTATDKPLSLTNRYFDRHGRDMSLLRVRVINPHLHMLKTKPVMEWSARLGAAAAGLGSVLACWLALRKSFHTKRRKVYIPSPAARFLGWLAAFCILEGALRFFMTVYWAWVNYQNGEMGYGVFVLETLFILFFLLRLYRQKITMRVLNIGRNDIHRLVRDFFAQANLKPEWIEAQSRYVTPPLDVRVSYAPQKFHAYLAFRSRGREGQVLAQNLARFLRTETAGMQAPARTQAIALYYPSVAFCYFLLAGIAFYTLYQIVKGY